VILLKKKLKRSWRRLSYAIPRSLSILAKNRVLIIMLKLFLTIVMRGSSVPIAVKDMLKEELLKYMNF